MDALYKTTLHILPMKIAPVTKIGKYPQLIYSFDTPFVVVREIVVLPVDYILYI